MVGQTICEQELGVGNYSGYSHATELEFVDFMMSLCLYRDSHEARYLYVTSRLINQNIFRPIVVVQVQQFDLPWFQIPRGKVNSVIKIRLLLAFFLL